MTLPPLAELTPSNPKRVYGQKHLIGNDSGLFKSLKSGIIPSIIFWGPPGVGKT